MATLIWIAIPFILLVVFIIVYRLFKLLLINIQNQESILPATFHYESQIKHNPKSKEQEGHQNKQSSTIVQQPSKCNTINGEAHQNRSIQEQSNINSGQNSQRVNDLPKQQNSNFINDSQINIYQQNNDPKLSMCKMNQENKFDGSKGNSVSPIKMTSNNENFEQVLSKHNTNQNMSEILFNELRDDHRESLNNQSLMVSYFFELQSARSFKYLRFNKNKIIYVVDNSNYYSGIAFSYKVEYDMDYNPKYEIYKGELKSGRKSGYGILYGGKSKDINYEGEWKDDQQFIKKQESQRQIQQNINQMGIPKKKILIFEEGNLIQIDRNNQKQTDVNSQNTWIKYNQQYNQNDMNRLQSETLWFTSSIIDGFVLYLNINIDNCIVKFLQKSIKRYLFFPSYIYTNMSEGRIQDNLNIYQNYILEYQPINYNLQKLFSRVYFAINQKNSHFFLLYIDFTEKSLNIVDSISKSINYYQTQINIFKNIFKDEINQTKIIQCIQQKNGYDCGPYTCLNMYKDFCNLIQQVTKIKNEINNPQEMRKFLYDILNNKNNNN